MPIILDPTQINPAALTVPAVYLVVEPPQASITGVPASVVGRVGSASWGPLNTPVLVGNLQEQNILFGPISAASLTDPYDMATDTWASLQQAGQFGMSSQQVRVSDGTEAQATLEVLDNTGDTQTVTVGGTKQTGDVLKLTFTNARIIGNPITLSYTVLSGDSLTTIATALSGLINGNTALSNAGITSTHASAIVTVHTNTDLDIIPVITNATVYKETIVVGGTKTTDDVLELTFTNAGITGSPVAVDYTVLVGDTLTTIATGLKAAINSNSDLTAAGITATSVGTSITVANSNQLIIPVITDTSSGTPSESLTITPGSTETIVIVASAGANGGLLTALYSGVLGNQIKFSILPGTSASLVNVLLTAWPGKAQEFYQGLPNTSAFWAALASALSSGIGTQRPPSSLARFVVASSSAGPQLQVATALSGGLDGRSGLTADDLIGSATGGVSAQGSGMYALLNAIPMPQQAWLVGVVDQTVWPTMQQFASANGILMAICEPIGTSVSAAVSDLENYGIDNYEVMCFIDWVEMYDPVNQVHRFVYPAGPLGGLCAALSPEQSPLNKQMQGVSATYRLQNAGPYSNADISLANTNGVALVSNPIGAGPQFGFITAVNSSLNNIGTAPIEYSRMTNFLIQSVGANLGQFLGKLQSQQPVDPVRSAIKSNLNSFMAQLEGNRQLDAHVVLCEFSQSNSSPGYNTPTTIAQHICSVFVAATYLSSIWYLIFTLQGGTTVSVQNVVSPQPPSA